MNWDFLIGFVSGWIIAEIMASILLKSKHKKNIPLDTSGTHFYKPKYMYCSDGCSQHSVPEINKKRVK